MLSKIIASDGSVDRYVKMDMRVGCMRPSAIEVKVVAMEVFSGCGALTAAINAHPEMFCKSFDILQGPGGNILRAEVWQLLSDAVDTGYVNYIHLAPPCSTYSEARWPAIRSMGTMIS